MLGDGDDTFGSKYSASSLSICYRSRIVFSPSL